MIIIKLNGFSNYDIGRVLTKLIIIVSTIMTILNFSLSPLAVQERSKIEHQIQHEQNIYSLKEGAFNISSDKSKVIYISDKDKELAANIFIKSNANSSNRIEIASGVNNNKNDTNSIRLDDGISYVFNIDGSFSTTRYTSQDVLLVNKLPELVNNDVETKSITQLFILNNFFAFSEIYNRVSIILSTIILAYLAVPLSNLSKKNDKYKNIFVATIFYFSYVILINILSTSSTNIDQLFWYTTILHSSFLFLTYSLYKNTSRAMR